MALCVDAGFALYFHLILIVVYQNWPLRGIFFALGRSFGDFILTCGGFIKLIIGNKENGRTHFCRQ